MSGRIERNRLSQCDGLEWRSGLAGLKGDQVDGQMQSIFQFVLDACSLQNRHDGIAFYQEIDITAPHLIVKP